MKLWHSAVESNLIIKYVAIYTRTLDFVLVLSKHVEKSLSYKII